MTKSQIIDHILNTDFSDLDSRLDALMEQGRITGGARYYVYNPYQFYGYTRIMEILDKAAHSKNYTRYIKRIDSFTYSYCLENFQKNMAKALAFVEEQEALPFESTQKQLLIQKGELV